jgi:UDP-perosamine 4-acetyltransferase
VTDTVAAMAGPEIVVVGAGGHALVALDVLVSAGLPVAGCVSDDGVAQADIAALGVEMLGTTDVLLQRLRGGAVELFVAIGDNHARRDITLRLESAGARLAAAVSPAAVISPHAVVAPGALVMPGAVINALATIGPGAIVNTGASVDHECEVGPFVHIAPGVAMAGNVVVGEGALLGIGAAVTPGRRIGAWSTVGAGATVVCDVPDGAVVVGTPARPIGGHS